MSPAMAAEGLTVQTALREGSTRLRSAGVASAEREAEWLLSGLLGLKPLDLYLEDRPVDPARLSAFYSRIAARAAGQPLQYVLGEAEFFGERFTVEPGVFIPRPETEQVLEAAIGALKPLEAERGRALRLLELGVGSGAIAVTLARALPTCVVVGVELSWVALRIARQNVLRHGLLARVRLVQGQWAEAIAGTFDGLIANPPYVPSGQVDRLPFDVRQEPRISLDGGPDGLRDLQTLMRETPRLLAPRGIAVFECGEEQVESLLARARAAAWVDSSAPLHDLAARPRGVLMRRA